MPTQVESCRAASCRVESRRVVSRQHCQFALFRVSSAAAPRLPAQPGSSQSPFAWWWALRRRAHRRVVHKMRARLRQLRAVSWCESTWRTAWRGLQERSEVFQVQRTDGHATLADGFAAWRGAPPRGDSDHATAYWLRHGIVHLCRAGRAAEARVTRAMHTRARADTPGRPRADHNGDARR